MPAGTSVEVLAGELRRTTNGIRHRLLHLGLELPGEESTAVSPAS